MTAALLAGVALGAASSAHCAAMCGPLVLAIGRHLGGSSRASQMRYALLHHLGRILTYAVLAVPAGLGGEMLTVKGFGRALAIVSGLLLLVAAAAAVRLPGVDRVTARVSAIVGRAFAPVLSWATARPIAGPLATGALNGLLPCGMVYAALALAAASGSLAASITLMMGFGAGTAGVLVAMTMGAASISPSVRLRLRPIGPVVLAIAAAVLLVRGVTIPHAHDAAAHHTHPTVLAR